MLITPERNRRNRRLAMVLAGLVAVGLGIVGCFYPAFLPSVLLGLPVYWLARRRCRRRRVAGAKRSGAPVVGQ